MKPFRWPPDKNDLLKQERGISFEDITVAVEAGGLLEVVPHPKLAEKEPAVTSAQRRLNPRSS
jgi:hypothetical protein